MSNKLTYSPVDHDHEEFLREAKKDEAFRKEYKDLAPVYVLLRELFFYTKKFINVGYK